MMQCQKSRFARGLLLALWAAGGLLVSVAALAADAPQKSPAAKAKAAGPKKSSPYVAGMPASARGFYAMTWGIDELSARLAESGQLVRFSYRVVDAAKAAPLQEKASAPYLLDEKVHAVLQVPTMEKVGPLRQSTAPENGKTYWMVFSNKGNIVKAGHRVSVVIGPVRVDGLVVR
jgi:hypothetical protein